MIETWLKLSISIYRLWFENCNIILSEFFVCSKYALCRWISINNSWLKSNHKGVGRIVLQIGLCKWYSGEHFMQCSWLSTNVMKQKLLQLFGHKFQCLGWIPLLKCVLNVNGILFQGLEGFALPIFKFYLSELFESSLKINSQVNTKTVKPTCWKQKHSKITRKTVKRNKSLRLFTVR